MFSALTTLFRSTIVRAPTPFLPRLGALPSTTSSSSTPSAPSMTRSMYLVRGEKYRSEKIFKERLRAIKFYLPKARRKGTFLHVMEKEKWFRMRKGKQGERPRKPGYGRHDHILSKMNL
ncbi:hypothetical protein HK104_003295 [Borealophlyctis nickersoniae]|nr:hypothetical protein HK104_003295 [Borealophlyctis nickersoniae]